MDTFDELSFFDLDTSLRSLTSTTLPPPTNVADLKSSFTSGLQTNTDLENMFLEMDNEDPERILDFIEMENNDQEEQHHRSLSTPTHDNRAGASTTTSHAAARPLKKRKTRTNSRRRISTSSDNMESCFFSRAWLGKIEHNEHNDVDEDLLLCPPFSTKRRRITPPSSPVTHQLIDCHISSMTDLRKLAPPTRNNVTNTTSEECQQFTEALRNLGASMKRSELSRRQINIQESVMTKVIRDNVMLNIEQQVQQATKWGVTISPSSSSSSAATTSSAPCRHVTHPTTGEDITYRMEQFFNGSRGTLTDGLEESRKQLRMYAC